MTVNRRVFVRLYRRTGFVGHSRSYIILSLSSKSAGRTILYSFTEYQGPVGKLTDRPGDGDSLRDRPINPRPST